MRTNWVELNLPMPPRRQGKWVRVVARIRKNATMEVRDYEVDEILEDKKPWPSTFNWVEGNNACDCNRKIFFERAHGVTVDDGDAPCGESGYSVQLINPATGQAYYAEF